MDETEIRNLYTRLCRDSGFRLEYIQAAILLARVIGCSPLEVWLAIGSLEGMERIAKGGAKSA